MDFLFTKLIVTLRLLTDVPDPYLLFFLKSGFPSAFREAVCRSDGRCASCEARSDCSYHATFSRELTSDSAALKRHQKPSVPFVLQIPVLPATARKDSEVELGLVLIGSAMSHVKDYWSALQCLFQRTYLPFSVVRAESVGCSGFRTHLTRGAEDLNTELLTTLSLEDLLALDTLDPERISLRIVTPLRIAREGRMLRSFSFSRFIRTLMRRVSSLAYYYYYCSALDMNYKRLSALSDSVSLEQDCFRWVESRTSRLEGLVGSCVLRGELTEFHPVLLLGEYLQCGKDAAFGLGRYELGR